LGWGPVGVRSGGGGGAGGVGVRFFLGGGGWGLGFGVRTAAAAAAAAAATAGHGTRNNNPKPEPRAQENEEHRAQHTAASGYGGLCASRITSGCTADRRRSCVLVYAWTALAAKLRSAHRQQCIGCGTTSGASTAAGSAARGYSPTCIGGWGCLIFVISFQDLAGLERRVSCVQLFFSYSRARVEPTTHWWQPPALVCPPADFFVFVCEGGGFYSIPGSAAPASKSDWSGACDAP
jgi:hypothetical protein